MSTRSTGNRASPKKSIQLNGYSVERKDRIDSTGRGVMIAIRTGISYSVIMKNNTIETIAVKFKIDTSEYKLINTYITPLSTSSETEAH
jgi:LysM repeat protein